MKNTPFPELLRHMAGPLLLSFVLAAIALASFAWLADEVGEGDTQRMDLAIRSAVHEVATPPVTTMARAFSFWGSMLITSIVSGAVIAWLLWLQHRRSAIVMAAAVIGGGVLNFILKLAFHRTRPAPFFDTLLPASYSFPSGHALFSVCIYLTLAWTLTALYPRFKLFIWGVAVVLMLGIGLSRIYLGVHYPSDVLGGYLAGFVWVSAVQAFAARRAPPTSSN